MSKRCQNLLLQIYLHFPEVIQHVALPESTFSSGGAADGSSCKVKMSSLCYRTSCLILCRLLVYFFVSNNVKVDYKYKQHQHARIQ